MKSPISAASSYTFATTGGKFGIVSSYYVGRNELDFKRYLQIREYCSSRFRYIQRGW